MRVRVRACGVCLYIYIQGEEESERESERESKVRLERTLKDW